MILLNGAKASEKIREEIASELELMNGYIPKLAIIRTGERPEDISYERGAVKKLKSFGLEAEVFAFPGDINAYEFKNRVREINSDADIDGILLFRPLPGQLESEGIEDLISPYKDVDGICSANIAGVFTGDKESFAPCTAEAVIELLKAYDTDIEGKKAVIVGRSMVVGRPLSMLLLKENATVTVCHTRTAGLENECRRADILIAAAGKAEFIGESHISDNAVVIDVGINTGEDGKLCGDVDRKAIENRDISLSPVPGGVGAVTTAVLAKHLLKAAKYHLSFNTGLN